MGNHQKHRFSGDTLRAKAGLLQQQHLENRIHQPDAVPSPNMSVLSASKTPQWLKMHTDTEHYILISPKLMAQQSWIKGYFQAYRTELKQAAFSSHFLQEEQPQTLHPWTVTAFSSPVCLLPFKIQSILFKSIPSGPHSWIPWISLKCKSSTCKHTELHRHTVLIYLGFHCKHHLFSVLQYVFMYFNKHLASLILFLHNYLCPLMAATVQVHLQLQPQSAALWTEKWQIHPKALKNKLVKTPHIVAAWCWWMQTKHSISKVCKPSENMKNPLERGKNSVK